jgi:FkbH-like protein
LSAGLYKCLSWLPKTPENFNELCRELAVRTDNPQSSGCGLSLQQLASTALNENQLHRVAKLIGQAQAKGTSLAPLIPFRLGILGNATLDLVGPALIATAARHGIALECVIAPYDQVLQSACSVDSAMNQAKCDAVLVAIDYRALPVTSSPGDGARASEQVRFALDYLAKIQHGIHSHSGAICLFQSFAAPPERVWGNLDRMLPGSLAHLVDRINEELCGNMLPGSGDVLFDVAGLAATVGLADWHSPEQWNLGRLPFETSCLQIYAELCVRLIASIRGLSRKCLILDLDNTLWGGIIGDDGVENIRLAQGDPMGEAFLDVQRLALALRERGIVLAVSSKNDDEVARIPFRKHPEMLLREHHIAIFQANWKDKAANIRTIAQELSFGLDAFVLLDDNPVERALVRKELPQVAVPELPADPALYARTLAAAGYFEAITFSDEDRMRADSYQTNARTVALRQGSDSLDEYLLSLAMEATFEPFDLINRARIAQLINKSNQFNLTTRRYTEAQIAAMEADPTCFTIQVRLTDRFGDNGIISVIICRASQATWSIDTWLMSCRVLGRRVEQAVLNELVASAKEAGVPTLLGHYLPSGRNQLVAHHYENLGFSRNETYSGAGSEWILDVASADVQPTPVSSRRSGGPSTSHARAVAGGGRL